MPSCLINWLARTVPQAPTFRINCSSPSSFLQNQCAIPGFITIINQLFLIPVLYLISRSKFQFAYDVRYVVGVDTFIGLRCTLYFRGNYFHREPSAAWPRAISPGQNCKIAAEDTLSRKIKLNIFFFQRIYRNIMLLLKHPASRNTVIRVRAACSQLDEDGIHRRASTRRAAGGRQVRSGTRRRILT